MNIPNVLRKFLFFMVLLQIPAVTLANAEKHALVIGNSSYNDGALANPVNDAKDMAAQLDSMGYKVFGGGAALNLDRKGILAAVQEFARQLPNEAHALFYYAGHGMATEQNNYLIPVGHNLEFSEQLPEMAVGLRSLVNLLKRSNPNGMNIVLLDACRDNPLRNNFRSTQRGLTRISDLPRGLFIGYAADFGQYAEDGNGRNGTYTSAVLSVMREKPGEIIEVAHNEISARVVNMTNGKQFPVSESKVYGKWCFGSCTAPIVTARTQTVETTTPEKAEISSNRKRWYVIGGVVLAAVAAGLATQDSGSEPGENFVLKLSPPE